jgi:D-3-phosphoglycerate dehydrogenase / 2-oxoglutarate reductase
MSEKKKVLITDRFSQEGLLILENQNFMKVEKTKTPDLANEELKDVHALIIRSRTKINEELFKKAKKLQVIVTATSGFDHIDLEAAAKWGVTVMFTPDANVESAAQLTWALVLACANKILPATKTVKSGEWKREDVTGLELARKTYGIVGLGRIGQRVAEIANVFSMDVVAYDPYCDEQNFKDCDAERLAFEELLKRSDVISFHVPATKETYQMLNRSNLEYINRGVIIVNSSRGSVLNENDLAEALERAWIGAVGLDVFDKEPLARTSKLHSFSNTVMVPHIGANTAEAFQKASEQAALKVLRFFMDSSTSDTLPPKAAWYGAQAPFQAKT